MRISIIAFLTLAALGGGELAARAIDPSAAPTEAQLREGTAEIDRRDACPTTAQREEDEVSLTSGTILQNGQDARSTRDELFCGTGILPVHQKLIENGAASLKNGAASVKNGQDARSTRDELFCGTGILPVHQKLIENGAASLKNGAAS
ncbi:hypothetical protein QUB08_25205, partial [Microcoleus sp. BR0-C5]